MKAFCYLLLAAFAFIALACSTDIEVQRTKHPYIDDKPVQTPAVKP